MIPVRGTEQGQSLLGRGLLGPALALAGGGDGLGQRPDLAGHGKLGLVRGAGFGDGLIDRDGLLPGLQIFLQARFGVFENAAGVGFFQVGAVNSADKIAAGIKAGVQIDGADNGLKRIGEDGGAPPAAAFELARAQYDLIGQPDLAADLGQFFPLDQGGPEPGQFALARLGETLVQGIGDNKTQQGVAEVFQPFVIVPASAAV